VDVSSTSRAAELAASDITGTSAAIAGLIAAETTGLDVLAECIEDREDNTTRFFVIRREAGDQTLPPLPEKLTVPSLKTAIPVSAGIQDLASENTPNKVIEDQPPPFKSLVSFTVPTRAPGALADVLDCFRRYHLNLTSINSLPSLIQPFQYLFFLEFEGSKTHDSEGRVQDALKAMEGVAQSWRWLGSWSNQRK
jgi:prephenate dehydratase